MTSVFYDNQNPVYRNTAGTTSITVDASNNELIISNTALSKTITINSEQFSNGTQTLPYAQMYENINAVDACVFPAPNASTVRVNNTLELNNGGGSVGSLTATGSHLNITSSSGNVNIKSINSNQNSTHYLNMSDSSADEVGAIQKSANISCNPNQGSITATGTITGGLISGPIDLPGDNTSTLSYIPFSKTTGSGQLYIDTVSSLMRYQPSTGSILGANFNCYDVTQPLGIGANNSSGAINIGGALTTGVLNIGVTSTHSTQINIGSTNSFQRIISNAVHRFANVIRTSLTTTPSGDVANLGYTVNQSTGSWTLAIPANTQTNITSVTFNSTNYGTYLFDAKILINPANNSVPRQQILGISETSGNYGNNTDLQYTEADVGYPMLKVTRVLNIYANTTVYLVGYVLGTSGTVITSGSLGIFSYTRIA
jgi:hypothetical protein